MSRRSSPSIETVRPPLCLQQVQRAAGVVQASAPASLVEGGLPTEALLAQVADREVRRSLPAVSPVADLRALGDRGSPRDIGDVGGAGVVSPAPRGRLPEGRAEEVEPPGSGRDHDPRSRPRVGARRRRATCGTLVRDERHWSGADPPGVVYRYEPGRGGKYGARLLKGLFGGRCSSTPTRATRSWRGRIDPAAL